ncbi:MAG TPA: DNA-binding protein [Acidiferrobacter sp.]|nr:DNA-binding protein [Acidiferrobacter sp.]
MPRTGITRRQVFEVADRLAESGAQPTAVAVRGDLGKGSFTTINQHLGEWKALKWKAEGQPATVPAMVEAKAGDLLTTLWLFASHEANQNIDRIREAALKDVAELQGQLQEAVQQTQTLLKEREELYAQLAKAHAVTSKLGDQVVQLTHCLAATATKSGGAGATSKRRLIAD